MNKTEQKKILKQALNYIKKYSEPCPEKSGCNSPACTLGRKVIKNLKEAVEAK